jgi:hypothetical protein
MFIGSFAHYPEWSITRKLHNDEKVKFSLIFDNENIDILKEKYNNISNPFHYSYGQYMTFDEINEIINPSHNIYKDIQIENYKNNFDCKFYGDSFNCIANVFDVQKIFNVNLFEFTNNNIKIFKSINDYTIPKEYSKVKFIDGLSNQLFPLARKKINNIKNTVADNRFYAQEVVNRKYNISYNARNNVSVVAWEFMEGGYVQEYMRKSQLYNNITPRNVSLVNGVNAPDDIETDLDLEMLLNYGGVNVYYGETNGWLIEGYYDMLNLALDKKLPDIISISYGWSEYDQCSVTTCNNYTSQQYVMQTNINFLKLGLLGYTLVVSSGDAGSKGRTDEFCTTNRLNPDFPASSPFVVSVGATFTVVSNETVNWKSPICSKNNCVSGLDTVPISYDYVGWTTGGHFSGYANASTWEENFMNEYFNSGVYLPNASWNRNGHGVPTVSMNGHSCPVYGVSGQEEFEGIDGTSCSAPLFAGFLSFINDYQQMKQRPKIGPVQQLLYLMANTYPNVFMSSGYGYTYCTEDTCCGVDGGFQTPKTQTKWNPVYGLGEPNFGFMTLALDDLFS